LLAWEHRGGAGEQASSDCGDFGLTEPEPVPGGQDLASERSCADPPGGMLGGRMPLRTRVSLVGMVLCCTGARAALESLV
jgi:hypothetical protein